MARRQLSNPEGAPLMPGSTSPAADRAFRESLGEGGKGSAHQVSQWQISGLAWQGTAPLQVTSFLLPGDPRGGTRALCDLSGRGCTAAAGSGGGGWELMLPRFVSFHKLSAIQ